MTSLPMHGNICWRVQAKDASGKGEGMAKDAAERGEKVAHEAADRGADTAKQAAHKVARVQPELEVWHERGLRDTSCSMPVLWLHEAVRTTNI